jgi:hypothetical protein
MGFGKYFQSPYLEYTGWSYYSSDEDENNEGGRRRSSVAPPPVDPPPVDPPPPLPDESDFPPDDFTVISTPLRGLRTPASEIHRYHGVIPFIEGKTNQARLFQSNGPTNVEWLSFREELDDGIIKFGVPLERSYSETTDIVITLQFQLVSVTPLIPAAGWTHPATGFSVKCDQTNQNRIYSPPDPSINRAETGFLNYTIPAGTRNRPKTAQLNGDYPISWITWTVSHTGAPDANNPLGSLGAIQKVDTIVNIQRVRTTLAESYCNAQTAGTGVYTGVLPVPVPSSGPLINGQHCTQESALTDPNTFQDPPVPGLNTLQNGWQDFQKTNTYSAPVVDFYPPKFYIAACAVKLEAFIGNATNPRISTTTKIFNNPLTGQVSIVCWNNLPKGTTSVRCTVQNYDANGGGILACVHAGVHIPNSQPENDFTIFAPPPF